ncbi:MAG: hypothetical protein Q4G07_08450 [Oscillospiraceae bacterium]|nr:hypothetical protein [Oscillospiraceae bacterium]
MPMIFRAAFIGCGEQTDVQEPGFPASAGMGLYVGIKTPLSEEVPISY